MPRSLALNFHKSLSLRKGIARVWLGGEEQEVRREGMAPL